MKNELLYVKYFREKMCKEVRYIEELDEYFDDFKNDWEVVSDLEYDFVLLGEDLFVDVVLILLRLVFIEGEMKS